VRDRLRDALTEAQRRGFLGPGPVEDQLRHAEGFTELVGEPAGPFLDLGSGAGLPGLVLAAAHPAAAGTLLDSQARRCAWLREAVELLGLSARLEVVEARAEEAARTEPLHSRFALVTARSFASPAVTAECAVGFLHVGGALAVSEPRSPDPSRWPPEPLSRLGFAPPETARTELVSVAVLRKIAAEDWRYPRRTGVPAKRPLW
jgi:hypothetical protein